MRSAMLSRLPVFANGQHAATERVRWACLFEAMAPKAGNVYPGASFTDLQFGDFVAAADAMACVLGAATADDRCGQLVLRSVQATRHACGTNVNLGIALLLAPLVLAETRRCSLRDVLQQLDASDAADVYAAIQLAQPGGMGESDQMDVRHSPPADLLAAMDLAADRDRIARQYVTDFSDLLDGVVSRSLRSAIADSGDTLVGICHAQIEILATQVDSLIARKCGMATAEEARARAQAVQTADNFDAAWRDFDGWLRADGHRRNPGTTADLIAAALWVLLGETQAER